MEAFEKHLQTSQEMQNSDGEVVRSIVLSVERVEIIGQEWIVGKHMGSEIETYVTHYYATIYETVSIVFFFSFHATLCLEYKDIGASMAASLDFY